MKSLTFCTCMIGMFLVSSVAFGEIVYTHDFDLDGDGDWYIDSNQEDTILEAWAHVEDPSSWADVAAWQRYTVTEDNTYTNWDYFLGSYSFARVWRDDDDPHSAYVSSYAYVDSPYCTDYAVTWVSIDEDYEDWKSYTEKEDGPTTKEDEGSGWFDENESFYLDHQVYVEADITEGSDDIVHAYGRAKASGNLEEYIP